MYYLHRIENYDLKRIAVFLVQVSRLIVRLFIIEINFIVYLFLKCENMSNGCFPPLYNYLYDILFIITCDVSYYFQSNIRSIEFKEVFLTRNSVKIALFAWSPCEILYYNKTRWSSLVL